MRFRWYSIAIHKFISADFIEDINKYYYTPGNPISFIDPLGLYFDDTITPEEAQALGMSSQDVVRSAQLMRWVVERCLLINSNPVVRRMMEDLRDVNIPESETTGIKTNKGIRLISSFSGKRILATLSNGDFVLLYQEDTTQTSNQFHPVWYSKRVESGIMKK